MIYDDDITDALVKTLRYLLARLPNRPDGQPPHCIMAMEKR